MENIKEISSCGLCGCDKLTTYLNFGSSPLANSLKEKIDEKEFQAPLEIVKCENTDCQCFQLKHQVSPEILFNNYSYRSAIGLQKHFEEYAKTTSEYLKLEKGDFIVGIGGNTGLLEQEYQKLGFCNVVNVEPAKNIAQESKQSGVTTFTGFFNEDIDISGYNHLFAKLITCNNCFAHTDLKPIIEGVKTLLNEDGFLIIENSYWLDVVKNSDAFQCYSEHYFYHHIKGLKNFFDIHGFDLFKVTYSSVQCGSFRIYVKWKENKKFEIDNSVAAAIKNEEEFGLFDKETYHDLIGKLFHIKFKLGTILNEITQQNKKIGIFGVAAKTVLMLKYFGISEYFSLATDDSDLKWQKFIPGTSIKIVSKDEFWSQNFDYVLPGAYNFFDFIRERNKDKNCKWIRVLPKLEIV